MPTNIDPTNLAGFRVSNSLFPKELPKALAVSCNFSADTEYVIDLQKAADEARLQIIQAIYIDNRLNAQPMVLKASISNQTIVAKPNWQGYLPLLSPAGAKFTATMYGGAGACTIQFLNFPVPAFGQNIFDPLFGDEIYNGTVTTVGASNVITVPANLAFFVTEINVGISPDAALAAAGELVIALNDQSAGAGTIAQGIVYLPAATPATPLIAVPPIINIKSAQYVGKETQSNLVIVLGSALTAGKVFYNIVGGLTSIIS